MIGVGSVMVWCWIIWVGWLVVGNCFGLSGSSRGLGIGYGFVVLIVVIVVGGWGWWCVVVVVDLMVGYCF